MIIKQAARIQTENSVQCFCEDKLRGGFSNVTLENKNLVKLSFGGRVEFTRKGVSFLKLEGRLDKSINR